jgi:hypothetical protein
MPYQLRNSTRVGETEPTPSSIASSATLEHNKDEADKLLPNRGLGEPWSRMDREYLQLVMDDVPKNPDYDTHNKLFQRSRELWISRTRPAQ